MLAADIPGKFKIPFANAAGGGYIRAIPQASQIGITDGAASLTDGFVPLNFLAVGAGGVPPFGQDFNGLLKQITQWLQWAVAGGLPVVHDSSLSTAIGGYPKGALLQQAANQNAYWISQVDNNLSDPDSAGANWLAFPTQTMKSYFNVVDQYTTTRVSMVGNAGNSYTVQAWAPAAYTKVSPTSNLVVRALLPTLTNTSSGCALLDLYINGSLYQTFTAANSQNNVSLVISVGSTSILATKSGLGAGAVAVAFKYRRADSTGWATVFCPISSDAPWYDATSQASCELSEIEP